VRSAAAARGTLALALLPLLAACGGAAPSSVGAPSPSRTATSTPPASATRTAPSAPSSTPSRSGCRTGLQITVKGTRVTPAPGTIEVQSGCEVALTITADRPNQVHVHVADLMEELAAGRPLTVTFTAEQTGVYEVELHDPELLLVKLAVR